jgi:hypothetical protein
MVTEGWPPLVHRRRGGRSSVVLTGFADAVSAVRPWLASRRCRRSAVAPLDLEQRGGRILAPPRSGWPSGARARGGCHSESEEGARGTRSSRYNPSVQQTGGSPRAHFHTGVESARLLGGVTVRLAARS